jgi:hypothetical protein
MWILVILSKSIESHGCLERGDVPVNKVKRTLCHYLYRWKYLLTGMDQYFYYLRVTEIHIQ